MHENYNVILKVWRSHGCPKRPDGLHWAYYVFENEADKDYWLTEHIDEENRVYWRHYEFMSLPCKHCGAYSPLRSQTQFSNNIDGSLDRKSCRKDQIVNHRPKDALSNSMAYYRELGFVYVFFKGTLSDSLCGQETFVLKEMP